MCEGSQPPSEPTMELFLGLAGKQALYTLSLSLWRKKRKKNPLLLPVQTPSDFPPIIAFFLLANPSLHSISIRAELPHRLG